MLSQYFKDDGNEVINCSGDADFTICHTALDLATTGEKEVVLTLIASAKPRSARGASHQPAFMSGCLTISHTCLPCLRGKGLLLY